MLKLKNIAINDNIATMLVLIECNENEAYSLTLDISGEWGKVISSEIPDEYKNYESQAIMALHEERENDIPTELTSAWY